MGDVPLKEYIETLIKWVDRYFESQIKTIQEKTREAAAQIDKRLGGMNEFRDTLKDQAGRLATRIEMITLEKSVDVRLKLLELRDARITGMAAIVSVVVSIVTAVVVGYMFK